MRYRLLALLPLFLPLAAQSAVLYRSEFQQLPDGTTSVPGWSFAGAEYRIAAGWLTVKSERSNPVATLQATTSGDFTYRARVRGATRVHWAAIHAGPYRLELNNQFVRLALMKEGQAEPVASGGDYHRYMYQSDVCELRLVRKGNRLLGFVDSRKLVDVELAEHLPAGIRFGLLGGWGTNVAWSQISLTDEPDETEWPREKLPEPTGRKYVEVQRVAPLPPAEGGRIALRVLARPTPASPGPTALRFRLVDINGKLVRTQQIAVDPREAEDWAFDVRMEPEGFGVFKLALDAGHGADDFGWVEDLGSFTVVAPELETRPRIPNSYFGSHMDGINLEWHLQQARRIGVQWARCHDMMQWTWWDRIQPTGPEEWKWGDAAQAVVDRLGFQTSGEFLWVPKWAQNPAAPRNVNPATYPPADLDAFARYVYQTVSHFKGSIHVWEMWNEPHYSGFFSGTPQQYAQMLQIAYREAKRADPTCLVMGGGGVNMQSMGWIAEMLKAAGGQSMDVFSIHYLDPDRAKSDMAWLRERLAEVGFRGPIWNSEESVLSSSFLDQCRVDVAEPEARYHYRNACYELVRTHMENLANGVSRVFYYELADPWRMKAFDKPRVGQESQLTSSLWDEGRALKPLGAAYAALALAIDGLPFVERIDSGPLQVFIFGDAQAATAVQYALYPSYARRERLRLSLPAGVEVSRLRAMDFMGNSRNLLRDGDALSLPLSREPMYLFCTGPGAAATLGRMYRAAVFPR